MQMHSDCDAMHVMDEECAWCGFSWPEPTVSWLTWLARIFTLRVGSRVGKVFARAA